VPLNSEVPQLRLRLFPVAVNNLAHSCLQHELLRNDSELRLFQAIYVQVIVDLGTHHNQRGVDGLEKFKRFHLIELDRALAFNVFGKKLNSLRHSIDRRLQILNQRHSQLLLHQLVRAGLLQLNHRGQIAKQKQSALL
jgi:hypothetical protein